jgi:hypothetical protein
VGRSDLSDLLFLLLWDLSDPLRRWILSVRLAQSHLWILSGQSRLSVLSIRLLRSGQSAQSRP